MGRCLVEEAPRHLGPPHGEPALDQGLERRRRDVDIVTDAARASVRHCNDRLAGARSDFDLFAAEGVVVGVAVRSVCRKRIDGGSCQHIYIYTWDQKRMTVARSCATSGPNLSKGDMGYPVAPVCRY